jgi:membrane peptidoglycan carboxypeptidase
MKLEGNLDLNRCKVLAAGPNVKVPLEKLKRGSFKHRVEEPNGKVYEFTVGEDSADWTPLPEISEYMVKGILTTEDGGFFSHKGFITSQVLKSIVENVAAGGFRRGASTITMQFVKNALLTREKTISRKLQEMALTWWVEQNLSKERILTLYFNLIEFGPGIYGIHDAAEHYFDCTPKELNPWQAAFLLSIFPNPKKYHSMFEKKSVGPVWTERVRRILDEMYERGRLTDEEYAAARSAPIVFGKSEFTPGGAPASAPSLPGPELEPEPDLLEP